VAALWTLRGFNRPTDVDKQTRLIAKGAHRAGAPSWKYFLGGLCEKCECAPGSRTPAPAACICAVYWHTPGALLRYWSSLKKKTERGRHQGDADGYIRAMHGASRDPGGPSLSRHPPSQLLALHQLPQRTQVLCGSHRSVGMEDDGQSDNTGCLCLLRPGHRRPRKPHPPRERAPGHGRSDAIEDRSGGLGCRSRRERPRVREQGQDGAVGAVHSIAHRTSTTSTAFTGPRLRLRRRLRQPAQRRARLRIGGGATPLPPPEVIH
jgi:hypothetical protein